MILFKCLCLVALKVLCKHCYHFTFSDLTLPTSTLRLLRIQFSSIDVLLRGFGYPPVHLSAYFVLGVIYSPLHTCFASLQD